MKAEKINIFRKTPENINKKQTIEIDKIKNYEELLTEVEKFGWKKISTGTPNPETVWKDDIGNTIIITPLNNINTILLNTGSIQIEFKI